MAVSGQTGRRTTLGDRTNLGWLLAPGLSLAQRWQGVGKVLSQCLRLAACSKQDGMKRCKEEACRGPNLETKRCISKEIAWTHWYQAGKETAEIWQSKRAEWTEVGPWEKNHEEMGWEGWTSKPSRSHWGHKVEVLTWHDGGCLSSEHSGRRSRRTPILRSSSFVFDSSQAAITWDPVSKWVWAGTSIKSVKTEQKPYGSKGIPISNSPYPSTAYLQHPASIHYHSLVIPLSILLMLPQTHVEQWQWCPSLKQAKQCDTLPSAFQNLCGSHWSFRQ